MHLLRDCTDLHELFTILSGTNPEHVNAQLRFAVALKHLSDGHALVCISTTYVGVRQH